MYILTIRNWRWRHVVHKIMVREYELVWYNFFSGSDNMLKLVFNDFIGDELKEYLSVQEGIISVTTSSENEGVCLNIEYDNNITPEMIYSFIVLFKKYNNSYLFKFDKGLEGSFKTYTHIVEDMCCEYCYMNFVEELFKNENIKSITSNYVIGGDASNINFTIEYKDNYKKEDLINYLNNIFK